MVERITITMKSDLLKRIDRMIDGRAIRNRSHAIENVLLKTIGKTDLDKVVIMAGGLGTSLRPITYEIPKPMIPIHGKPILEHQINMLKKYNLKDIIISIGYMHEKVENYFGDGARFGVNIEYVFEERPLGTIGSLSLLKNKVNGTFAMFNVDTLMDPNIPEILEFHKNQGTLATMLLTTATDTRKFGVVKMHGNKIVDFIEKPKGNAQSNLINAGFYILEPSVINMIPKNHTMTEDLFKVLAKKEQLSGFIYDKMIFDVDNHETYEKAIKEWKDMCSSKQV